jgi:hypothetical protein
MIQIIIVPRSFRPVVLVVFLRPGGFLRQLLRRMSNMTVLYEDYSITRTASHVDDMTIIKTMKTR